jgi:hypothetical protein
VRVLVDTTKRAFNGLAAVSNKVLVKDILILGGDRTPDLSAESVKIPLPEH